MPAIWYNDADFTVYREPAEHRRDRKYSNLLGALDLEWSTITACDPPISFVYLWTLSIEDITVYGRTWDDLRECLLNIRGDLGLSSDFKLILFDQNLKVDFAFFHSQLDISTKERDFLSRDRHTIIKCIANECFEIHDSLELTERPLSAMGDIIGLPKIDDYEYNLIRHYKTEITPHELEYAGRDTEIIINYMRRERERYGTVKNIPLTGTRVIKNQIYENYKKWGSICSTTKNQLHDNEEDREMLQRMIKAYFGAFNYCTCVEDNKPLEDILSVDLQSSYGAQILLNKFPIKKFIKSEIPADWRELLHMDKYAYIVKLNIKGLKNIYPRIGFLPANNKEWHCMGVDALNDKILKMRSGIITLTDVDFKLLCEFYTFDEEHTKILELHTSKYGYLPGYIVKTVVDNYVAKSDYKAYLKSVKKERPATLDEENEYQIRKTNVSRIYGVFVQRPLLIDYFFDPETHSVKERKDKNDEPIYRFTKSKHDPVLYQWGVWVTAFGRREILQNFAAVGLRRDTDGDGYNDDIVLYCATDSLKFKNSDAAINIILDYNAKVKQRLQHFCKMYGYNYSDLEGIGEFEFEHYQKFKCIGTSKYCYIDDLNEFTAKISGLSKDNVFFDQFETPEEKMEALQPEMEIAAELAQCRKTTYYSKPFTATVTDYNGITAEVSEKSYCVLGIQKFDSRIMPAGSNKRITKAQMHQATHPTKV